MTLLGILILYLFFIYISRYKTLPSPTKLEKGVVYFKISTFSSKFFSREIIVVKIEKSNFEILFLMDLSLIGKIVHFMCRNITLLHYFRKSYKLDFKIQNNYNSVRTFIKILEKCI